MNGFVRVKKSGVKDRLFKIIKKEELTSDGKTVLIYNLPFVNKKILKKLIKNLKRDNIKKVAFEDGISGEFKSVIENDFKIIKREDVLFNNIDKIVLKASNLLGIRKGKLKLGISAYDTDLTILNNLKSLKSRLKCIFVYTDNVKEKTIIADEFFKQTGVPTVVREEMCEEQSDILIVKGLKGMHIPDTVKFIFNLQEKPINDRRSKDDVAINMPEALKNLNASDSVISKLFKLKFSVNHFKIITREKRT